MEAATIPWRPLGRILVEQGLLTSEELEAALAQQEKTGRRLGETIVECGFVSGPELSSALAAQYGIELTTETGFGTGLRGQIQRRHENERRSLRPVRSDPAAQAAVAERDRLVGELRGEVERLSAAARSHDQQLEHERTESREALRAAGASVTEREEEIRAARL